MKNLIVANWKMNPASQKEAQELFEAVKAGVSDGAEVVICPPFVYLAGFKIQDSGIKLGAQNVSYKETGAFTSQISTLMLRDLGVEYVIVGHSESRKYLYETNQDISKKIKECCNAGLKVILCIGDQEGEDRNTILETQLTEGLNNISEQDMANVVVAYEPVWAIGTGKNCSVEDTKSAMDVIWGIIEKLYNKETADNMRLLYGGSVKPDNAAVYLQEGGVSGLLVGGASLKAEDFVSIVKSAE